MKGKRALLLLAGLSIGVLLGLAVLWGSGALPGTKSAGLPQGPEVGKTAPDFALETLDGNSVRLSQLKGHPVLVNFWATWCDPCKQEMPLFESYYKKLSPDLVILGLDYEEGKVLSKQFVDQYHISFPILLDEQGQTGAAYQVRGFPTTFFIDQDGILRSEHIGQVTEDLLISYLQTIGIKQ